MRLFFLIEIQVQIYNQYIYTNILGKFHHLNESVENKIQNLKNKLIKK